MKETLLFHKTQCAATRTIQTQSQYQKRYWLILAWRWSKRARDNPPRRGIAPQSLGLGRTTTTATPYGDGAISRRGRSAGRRRPFRLSVRELGHVYWVVQGKGEIWDSLPGCCPVRHFNVTGHLTSHQTCASLVFTNRLGERNAPGMFNGTPGIWIDKEPLTGSATFGNA